MESSMVEKDKKNNHQGHKMGKCLKCGKEGQDRRLTDGLCTTCSKGKGKTVVNAPISGIFNANALNQLPQKREIRPNDSISMIGVKRQRELLEEELSHSPQDIYDGDYPNEESEESKHEFPSKRQKAKEIWSISIATIKTDCIGQLVVSHADADALKKLIEIEKSTLPDDVLSMKLQSLCTMLPQEATVNLLQSQDYPKVASLIPLVLQRTSQLETPQHAGIIFSCLIFGGLHWQKAQSMLAVINSPAQAEVITLLGAFVKRTHGGGISQWLVENWNYVELYHFKLFDYLRVQKSSLSYELLHLSLCVKVDEITLFVEYATEFLKTPISKLLFEYLKSRKPQQKLVFQDFTALCSVLMFERNAPILETCKAVLIDTPLRDWIEFIEKAASTIHLSDKGSIQEAINEFIRTYGPIDETFSKDLFSAGSSLGLLLHETPNKGNFKQLGLAHYVIGGSRKVQRQLWCVPSGDGKSRIMVFAALLGLKTGMFKIVHLVYANKHLMERDKADFEDLWRLAECQDKVQYHIGRDFQPDENSLVLIDESDRLMFDEPKNFAEFIEKKFCVCFTATPSNCDQQGIEAEVVKALGFKQYSYLIDQAPVNVNARLQCDEVVQACSVEEKFAAIASLLKQGSVLVYAPSDLAEELRVLSEELVTVNETTNPLMLRQLDQTPYKFLVATDSFGMRGIDYRSKSNIMFLVIAQQFPCIREALQGIARVGRFGDPCRRIKFADCPQLVDQRSQLKHNAQLLRFIEESKPKVQVKAADTKKASPKKSQPAQGSRLSSSRTQKLSKLVPGQTSLAGFAGLQVPKKPE